MIILNPIYKEIEIIIRKKKKILYSGHFKIDNSAEYSIADLSLKHNDTIANISKKEFINLLKKQKIVLTCKNDDLIEFLEQENIKYTYKNFCQNCLEEDNIILLNENTQYLYENKYYCRSCAELYLELWIESNAVYDYRGNRSKILLDKYHNLEKIFEIVQKEYNPIENNNLTLYDTLPATEESYEKISPDTLNVPEKFTKILNEKIDYLLPVQKLAIENGLMKDENLLIVSSTASGKTLIGELAGIPKVLNHRKMIYLSPLVALANQKYRDFKREYEQLGLKIVIKVGYNRVKSEKELCIVEEAVDDADIIVATYESLDFILRSGNYELLNDLGVVIIDEIQMLEDEDRGHRLNGLINRLITLFPETQMIGLSATIKNSQEISDAFGMKLISYNKRPVKIQRHILPVNRNEKGEYIAQLCKKEFKTISSKNYHGQTIIFTSSRRNTHEISDYLNKKNIKSEAYHAGLTYERKLEIEEAFANQTISTVITTSALASGVDFPASLVIFESLRMGYEWISNNEFHQMFGRAGRPTYHDMGKVYLLPSNYNPNDYMTARDLLNSDVDNVNVLYDNDDVYEQVLADICAIQEVDFNNLKKKYDKILIPITLNEAIQELLDLKMIVNDSTTDSYRPTGYGIAVSKSFITTKVAEHIRNNLNENIINIALDIEVINNVYLEHKVIKFIETLEGCYISNSLYSDNIRNMFRCGEILYYLDANLKNRAINLINDFLDCDCYESPYCDCLEKKISKHIINRRIQGWTPKEISKEFRREYNLLIYAGDIYSYLDQIIRVLDSIKRIAKVHDEHDIYKECLKVIKKIEG